MPAAHALIYLDPNSIVGAFSGNLWAYGQTQSSFHERRPELLVLRLLASREMYGYEIVKAVRVVTEEAIALGEGVIYPALHARREERRAEIHA